MRENTKRRIDYDIKTKTEPNPISPMASEEISTVSGSNFSTDRQSTAGSLKCTPKRCRGRPRKTPEVFRTESQSTVCSFQCTPKRGEGQRKPPEAFRTSSPLHSLSTDRLPNMCDTCSEAEDWKNKMSEVASPCYTLRSQSKKRSIEAAQPRRLRKELPMIQTTSPAKRHCSKNLKKTITAMSSEQSRKRSIEAAQPRPLIKKLPMMQSTSSPAKRRCSKNLKKTITATSSEQSRKNSIEAAQPRRLIKKLPMMQSTSSPAKRRCSKKLKTITATSSEQSRKISIEAAQPGRLRKKLPMMQTTSSPTKRSCSKKLKTITATSSEPSRPRFELKEDESFLSSDLFTDLSDHKEQLTPLPFLEDEESVDEEELPSFLMQMRPLPITEGVFVWCKFRRFPTWPALVKHINLKAKKASIIFIDDQIRRQRRGVTVALKSLMPFECEGANELAAEAKEEWAAMMQWSLELITDYRIRIACGSFCGSFLEYFDHGISNPVRRKYPQASSEQLPITPDLLISEQLPITHDLLMAEEGQWVACKEDCEEPPKVNKCARRLLPDRTQAAHNRANEKLVDFITKQRMVEGRLLAVIRGQVQSRWLLYFQKSDRRFFGVETYLEDNTQLDKMYSYLSEVYEMAMPTPPGKAVAQYMRRIPFVLDVLLPEAITHAIAGMDNISIKKAEEKYLKGRCLSNREIQEYELMIENLCMRKP